jgi:hypothetical protein
MKTKALTYITFMIAVFAFCAGEVLAQTTPPVPIILNVVVENQPSTSSIPQNFTINGVNLMGSGGTTVTVGGRPLTLTSVSNNVITGTANCVLPR